MAEEKKIDKDTDVQIAHIIKNIRLMKKGVPTATDADRKLHKQVATLNKIIPSFNNGKMIKITDKCIGCKVCEKVCPTGNIIVLTDYAQRRSKKCEYCLACVHACPQTASFPFPCLSWYQHFPVWNIWEWQRTAKRLKT